MSARAREIAEEICERAHSAKGIYGEYYDDVITPSYESIWQFVAAETADLRRQVDFAEHYRPQIAAILGLRENTHWGDICVILDCRMKKLKDAILPNSAPSPPAERVVAIEPGFAIKNIGPDKWRKLLTEPSSLYISILAGLKYLANQPNMPASNYSEWRRWAGGCAARIEAALGHSPELDPFDNAAALDGGDEGKHVRECGTKYRGCAPDCPKHLAELDQQQREKGE